MKNKKNKKKIVWVLAGIGTIALVGTATWLILKEVKEIADSVNFTDDENLFV